MSGNSPLVARLKAEIRANGPISVARYMQACLYDPEYGYYSRGDIFGARGDFVTAPEISQVFGELIGLWCAAVWQSMGSPSRLSLVEFGPGRGTLMADALRAARRVPGCYDALSVHLVEASETLREVQATTLRGHDKVAIASAWPTADDLGDGGVVALGNEFVDACPIEQFVFCDGAWRLRMVGLDAAGDFVFEAGKGAYPNIDAGVAPRDGDVFEVSMVAAELGRYLGALALTRPVAALLIDYGHVSTGVGDTLQGVRGHRHVPALSGAGETDLSTQVDFAALGLALGGTAARGLGAVVEPVTTQAEFFGTLGIVERASRLMAANPSRASEIEAAVARLIAPNGMGTRFKVLGYRSGFAGPLPGFA